MREGWFWGSLGVREGWFGGSLVCQVVGSVQNGGVCEQGGPGGFCGLGMSFGRRAHPWKCSRPGRGPCPWHGVELWGPCPDSTSFCLALQPRKIEEIKDFLLTARRKDAKCERRSRGSRGGMLLPFPVDTEEFLGLGMPRDWG